MAEHPERDPRAAGDHHTTMADRPSVKVPESSVTPETRAGISGVRASLFPRGLGGTGVSQRGEASMITRAGEAMRDDEIERAQMFSKVIAVIIAATFVTLALLGGDPLAKWLFAGGLAAYLITETAITFAISRDPDHYTERKLYLPAVCGVFAAYTGVYYFGPFSAAPAVIVMALYFNSLILGFRYTLSVYLGCAIAQAGLAGAIMSGLIDDVGLIRADHLSTFGQLSTQTLIQLSFLATFLIARLSRRSTQASIERFEEAVRDVAQREALLNEARQELERAAWVGGPGRFTEQTLGSFRLGLIIGRGAMGEVYEGMHVATGEPAAVKLLHRNVLSDAAQVARFAREAEAVSKLDSPNVVRVLEVGDATSPIPYIAMERMVGDDLAAELRARRRLPVAEVLDLCDQVARGIDAAAAAGIVHRDLKPQNLFQARSTDGDTTWKILDFGVSKLTDGTGTITRGRVVGTPTYMAPEQARGRDVDHRADIYALGAIAYRALTGHPAFSGREVPQILYDVVHRMPARPGELAHDVPAAIDLVLAVALAKKPADRFASATELATSLAAAAHDDLDADVTRRAERLIDKYPWGAPVRSVV